MTETTETTAKSMARPLLIAAAVIIVLLIAFTLAERLLDRAEEGPTPETVVSTSLEALQAQNRLVPFTARFVSVVTSRQRRLGGLLEAERTLILPGTARYELDMSAIRERDLDYDAEARTLTVTIPEIEIAGPEVDLAGAQEYGETGVLGALTSADEVLTDANQNAALADLRKQAGSATPLRLAREAARTAVERNFELPLAVAGLDDVRVVARFASDPDRSDERVDVSRRPEDAIADRDRRRANGE